MLRSEKIVGNKICKNRIRTQIYFQFGQIEIHSKHKTIVFLFFFYFFLFVEIFTFNTRKERTPHTDNNEYV